jgi:hypothetical protein
LDENRPSDQTGILGERGDQQRTGGKTYAVTDVADSVG